MGGTKYNFSARLSKAAAEGYASKAANEIFKQNQVRRNRDGDKTDDGG